MNCFFPSFSNEIDDLTNVFFLSPLQEKVIRPTQEVNRDKKYVNSERLDERETEVKVKEKSMLNYEDHKSNLSGTPEEFHHIFFDRIITATNYRHNNERTADTSAFAHVSYASLNVKRADNCRSEC